VTLAPSKEKKKEEFCLTLVSREKRGKKGEGWGCSLVWALLGKKESLSPVGSEKEEGATSPGRKKKKKEERDTGVHWNPFVSEGKKGERTCRLFGLKGKKRGMA